MHEVLADALEAADLHLADDDVLVVTSKIVSKAEGRTVAIDEADPGARRRLILGEAACVLRHRGTLYSAGRQLDVTQVAIVDEIAAAAELVMGKAWGRPAALVRGLRVAGDGSVADLRRPPQDDLFRQDPALAP